MQILFTIVDADLPGLPPSTEGEEALPPAVSIRCGASETAAIIGLLDTLPATRQAIEAWDGVSRDSYQRCREKYARLLADLYTRHPGEVLAGLDRPQASTRLWVALALAQAAAPAALPALERALAAERDPLCRRALLRALAACEPARE